MTAIRLRRRANPIDLISVIGMMLLTAVTIIPTIGMIAASAQGLLL